MKSKITESKPRLFLAGKYLSTQKYVNVQA